MGASATRVGHADLLRLLVRLRADGAEPGAALAGLVGLAYRAPVAAAPASEPEPLPGAPPAAMPDPAPAPVDATQLRARQYQVKLSQTTLTETERQAVQGTWDAVWQLPEPEPLPEPAPPPPFQGISSRQRLTRAVERLVRSKQRSSQPDVERIVQTLARCQQPDWRKLQQQRAAWQGNGVVLALHAEDEPLRSDYYRIMRIVYRRSAGRVPLWLHLAGHGWFVKQNRHTDWREWQARPNLALPPQAARLTWLALGRLAPGFPAATVRVLWLVEPQATLADLTSLPSLPNLPCVGWHEAQPLTVWQRVPPWLAVSSEQVACLLALVSLTVSVEPRLLRALRRLLGLPPAAESACWGHPDVTGDGVAIALRPEKRAGYWAKLAQIDLAIRQAAARLIAAHHGDAGWMVQLDDAYTAHLYAAGGAAFDPARWYAKLARQIRAAHEGVGSAALAGEVAEWGHYLGRQGFRSGSRVWQDSAAFALAWAWAQRHALESGGQLPPDLPLATLARLCEAVGAAAPEGHGLWRVVQCDAQLHLYHHAPDSEPPRFAPELARWHGGPRVQWQVDAGEWREVDVRGAGAGDKLEDRAEEKSAGKSAGKSPENPVAVIGLESGQSLVLCDGAVLCEVQPLAVPAWARGRGRNADGVFVLAPVLWGEPVPVALPLVAGQALFRAQRQVDNKKKFTLEQVLTWDEQGLLATLRVSGPHGTAEQGLRWIEPGTFWMGRPEHEIGDDDELPQHQVTISHGFWLADTACSQALWLAVLGSNPARFNESNQGSPAHPVEQVSWNDVQAFLQQINQLIGQRQASLPTEAEWEYACRAGSTTPFWFEDAINRTQVNYNDNDPNERYLYPHKRYLYPHKRYLYIDYFDGNREKSQRHRQTVAVKDLPANPWGLYQMLGNVWEWCADDWRNYGAGPVCDPGLAAALALPTEHRQEGRVVMRGGSWLTGARDVRAVSRAAYDCGDRGDGIGFRLALRFPAGKGFGDRKPCVVEPRVVGFRVRRRMRRA